MFGDFLRNHEKINKSSLQHIAFGTPIVAKYSSNRYQFGIYAEGEVIFQRCFKMASLIFFSIEKVSVKRFAINAEIYEYTPQFNYDRSIAYNNASYFYSKGKGKAIPALVELRSVFGDDFALICMVGKDSFLEMFHQSKIGQHYQHRFMIGGLFPAMHHLIVVEEEHVIHFSRGDTLFVPHIIKEDLHEVSNRAFQKWNSKLKKVNSKHEDLNSRIIARNRALLVFAGLIDFGEYNLVSNNCEHFVSWCKTGKSHSKQVQDFFVDVAIMGLSFIAHRPQLAAMVLAKRFR